MKAQGPWDMGESKVDTFCPVGSSGTMANQFKTLRLAEARVYLNV